MPRDRRRLAAGLGALLAALAAISVAVPLAMDSEEVIPAFAGGRTPADNYATGKITGGCGAVALDAYTVLSAAHCLLPYDDDANPIASCDPDPGGDCTSSPPCTTCERYPVGFGKTFTLEETAVEYDLVYFDSPAPLWEFTGTDMVILKVREDTPITGVTFPALWDGSTADEFISQGYSTGVINECESEVEVDSGDSITFSCVDPPGATIAPGDSGGPTYAIISSVPYVAIVHSGGGSTIWGGPSLKDATNEAFVNDRLGLDAPILYDHGLGAELVELSQTTISGFPGNGPWEVGCDLRFNYTGPSRVPTEAFCIFGNLTPDPTTINNSTGTGNERVCQATLSGGLPYRRGSCSVTIPARSPQVRLLGYRIYAENFSVQNYDSGKIRYYDAHDNYWQRGWLSLATNAGVGIAQQDTAPPDISAYSVDDLTPAAGQELTLSVTTTDPAGVEPTSGIAYVGAVIETTARGGDFLSCTTDTPVSGDDYECSMTVPAGAGDDEEWTYKHAYSTDARGNTTRTGRGTAAFTVTAESPTVPTFTRVDVPNTGWPAQQTGDCKAIADIDLDGYPDAIIAGASYHWYNSGEREPLTWFKAPTPPSTDWSGSETQIAHSGDEWTTYMDVGDMDGDGDIDIVVPDVVTGDRVDLTLFWWENPCDPSGDVCTGDPTVPAQWDQHTIGTWQDAGAGAGEGDYIKDLMVIDIDQDGKLDVALKPEGYWCSGVCAWFQDDAALDNWTFADFTAHVVSTGSEGIWAGPIDTGDAYPEILADKGFLLNPGVSPATVRNPANWTAVLYDPAGDRSAAKVFIADIDDDGKPDIIRSEAEKETGTHYVEWFRQGATYSNWTQQNISSAARLDVHSLWAKDFDGSGTMDVMYVERSTEGAAGTIFIAYNDGADPDVTPITWSDEVVETDIHELHNVQVNDIDQDGDWDLFGAGNTSTYVEPDPCTLCGPRSTVWYNNLDPE